MKYANDIELTELARQIHNTESLQSHLTDGLLHGAFLRAQEMSLKLERLKERLNDLKYGANDTRREQRLFAKLVAQFITWAYSQGYEFTFGEALRTQAQADVNAKSGAGISNSLHLSRLAIDLNLFIGGQYQTDTQAYKPLGEYWKTLHPLCRWGGDFQSRPDGNHFSLEHNGVR